MDPDAVLKMIITTTSFTEYVEAWSNLAQWLSKGGFVPKNPVETFNRFIFIFRQNPTDTWHLQTVDPISYEKGWEIVHFVGDNVAKKYTLA